VSGPPAERSIGSSLGDLTGGNQASVDAALLVTKLEPSEARAAGRFLLDAADPGAASKWIRRRVENIRFVDDRTVHYEVVLHIDLPVFSKDLPALDRLSGIPVPLLRLSRDRHTSFQVRSSDGGLLTHVNAETERLLVAEGIVDRYRAELGPLVEQMRSALASALVGGLPPEDESEAPGWARSSRFRSWIRGTFGLEEPELSPDIEAPYQLLIAEFAPKPDNDLPDWAMALLADWDEWSNQYSLVVLMPVEDCEKPQVVRIRYLAAVPVRSAKFGLRAIFRSLRQAIGGSLSWGTQIHMPGVAYAHSFHVNSYAPDGFRVVDASLRFSGRTDKKVLWRFDDDRLPMAGHVFTRGYPEGYSKADFFTSLYLNKTGFYFETLLSSLLVASILVAFTFRLIDTDFIITGMFGSDFASALLLFVPVVGVAAITQRDVTRIASRTLAFPRFLQFVMLAAVLACAAPFSLGLSPKLTRSIWWPAAVTAWVVTGRVVIASLVHACRLLPIRERMVRSRRWLEQVRSQVLADPTNFESSSPPPFGVGHGRNHPR
jgi:hypothetical protein